MTTFSRMARLQFVSTAVILSMAVQSAPAFAQCVVEKSGTFGTEKVVLARPEAAPAGSALAIFKAPMAVNTDGAPNSYHPDDPLGKTIATNRYDNGIAIRRTDKQATTRAERDKVFGEWRASPTWAVPEGYTISWKNVIAADPSGYPCVFQSGEHKGYFGSLTALGNGLSGAALGECRVNNQLDQRFIPAIVLRGGAANPLSTYGAKAGDLVVAINPATGVIVPAIIGDTGNGDRIGEGSVALNMKLLGKTEQPKTYADAVKLDTGKADMIIAVIPGSKPYQLKRPYTAQNLSDRISAWATEKQYGSLDALAKAITTCSEGL